MPEYEPLIDLKTLKRELRVGYSFVLAMKKAGLPMPGGRTTVGDARKSLRAHPEFRVKDWIKQPAVKTAAPVALAAAPA